MRWYWRWGKPLTVHYKRGEHDAIHWSLYDDGELVAVSPPRGYHNRAEAEIHVAALIASRRAIVTEDET